MPFSAPLVTRWMPDGIRMMVVEAAEYTDPHGRAWEVPAGFVTDGASIPPEFWSLVGSPFTGKYRAAAVFHDAAYDTFGKSPTAKAEADKMLREAMIELGCPWAQVQAIYQGVRLGGASSWREDQSWANGGPPLEPLA